MHLQDKRQTAQESKENEKGKGKKNRILFPCSLFLFPFSLLLCGCAGFWDDVTSRNFRVKSLFVKTDPMVVLRDSTDGDERAKALRALREPKQHGGTNDEQDKVVHILTTAAAKDRQPLCRLAAIQTLGRFQDPRAVQGLTDAFYAAPSFPSETATVIQCQALTALGQTHNPAAVPLLARVVREPPAAADVTEQEKQQARDVRTAATRALANFKQSQGTEALVRVLQTEKDVALRNRAHESLQASTGKKLPPDPKAWEEVLQASYRVPAGEPSTKFNLLGWFQRAEPQPEEGTGPAPRLKPAAQPSLNPQR